jgi:hypothetical protein
MACFEGCVERPAMKKQVQSETTGIVKTNGSRGVAGRVVQTVPAVLAALLLVMLSGVVFHLLGQAGGTVTLVFYDREGNRMSQSEMRALSNNGGLAYNSDYLLEPGTLRAISAGPLFPSGAGMAFNIPARPVAFAINWPTQPTGFNLIVLDDGGEGFTSGGTINFTWEAAKDVRRRLDEALAARPGYVRSPAFNESYDAAVALIDPLKDSTDESAKGRAGQLALDNLAVAFDTLLREHGPVFAAANRDSLQPWIGFTIDRVSSYKTNLDLAASLSAPFGWVRIVFDASEGPGTYTAMVDYAKSKGLKVLGQPVDSSYDRRYTREQYRERFIQFLTAFPQIDAWEVGNEINGSWLSSDIALKVADAVAEVRSRAPGAQTFLTLFWQVNTASVANSMFTWVDRNLPVSVRSDIDVVTISQYQEQAPMGVVFNDVMTVLAEDFPDSRIGLGELGYWIPGQQFWWAYNAQDPEAAKRDVARQFYPASYDFPRSIGGGFWWTFIPDFINDLELRTIVSELRDRLLASAPQPSPTPTPTPTPGPTATATPTPEPTATPTPEPTPGGNVFGGEWAAVANVPPVASYSDLYQRVGVQPRTRCTASVWVKGSGSIELHVWGNPRWTRKLGSVRIDAGPEWRKFTTPVFNVRNRNRVWLSFDDAVSGTPGRMFLDQVFLGTADGDNQVRNPGFEDGGRAWTITSPAIFGIEQNP